MSIARKIMSGGPTGAWDLSYAYYDPPLAWNVTTARYIQSFDISPQSGSPVGLFFKPDGLKMYIIDILYRVYEYNLSTAWDVSTTSYVQNFSVFAQDSNPTGLFFKPDGFKMYVVGVAGDAVYEYTLGTPWDISTASYLQNFSVATQDTVPTDVFFKPDGTKMYVVGNSGSAVYEYNLSTAWDVSTASYVQNFSVVAQDSNPTDVFFRFDGIKMYVVGTAGDAVCEYNLSTAWDVSTASYLQSFSVAAYESSPQGVSFKPDGTKMYVVGVNNDRVNEYTLGGFSVAAQELTPQGLFFRPNGGSMYVIGNNGDAINQYSLSTEWDISTATYTQNFSVAAEDTNPQGIFFKSDGLKMYIVGYRSFDFESEFNEYDLSTAWDISTAVYNQTLAAGAIESLVGLFFKPDGTKMYGINNGLAEISGVDVVYEFSVGTAWDISTATYSQNFSVAAQDTVPADVFFKPDGLKMYVVGRAGDAVYEYSLSTAWDISTATYSQNFSVAAQDTFPTDVFFKPDGLKMYVVGGAGDAVYAYSLG